jgi:hypothetical protein
MVLWPVVSIIVMALVSAVVASDLGNGGIVGGLGMLHFWCFDGHAIFNDRNVDGSCVPLFVFVVEVFVVAVVVAGRGMLFGEDLRVHGQMSSLQLGHFGSVHWDTVHWKRSEIMLLGTWSVEERSLVDGVWVVQPSVSLGMGGKMGCFGVLDFGCFNRSSVGVMAILVSSRSNWQVCAGSLESVMWVGRIVDTLVMAKGVNVGE